VQRSRSFIDSLVHAVPGVVHEDLSVSVCSIYTSTTLASLRVASLYRTCTLFGHLPTSRTLRTATNTLAHAAKHPHSCNTFAVPFLFLSQRINIKYSPCQSFCTQNTPVNLSNFLSPSLQKGHAGCNTLHLIATHYNILFISSPFLPYLFSQALQTVRSTG